MKRLLFTMMATLLMAMATAQTTNVHEQSDGYEWPTDTLVVKKLHEWQDLKFGVLLHWGIYAVPGIVESWSICDEPWIKRDTTRTYQEYMDWYWGLADAFCPTLFDPQQWAMVCSDAGMKYMIFTTKHHDGFCMYDSQETGYTIARHAFKDDPRRDVLRHVFDAYRQQGFTIGAYFSKPDWHSQYYWWDIYAKKGRNVNYPVEQYPQRWEQFKRFTHRQIEEILTHYGQVDILWLDGGWVWPGRYGQDIDMPALACMARSCQPGIMIVDRTIRGPYENYQTPERTIPEQQLDYPWESCIPLTDDWGYTPNARYKTANKIIATLAEIVAKGGNMVLGVGPTPEGLINAEATERLHAIGQWMKANGAAIYGTVITPHYHEGRLWFTASKDGKRKYAIYCPPDDQEVPDNPEIPGKAGFQLSWTVNIPQKGVRMLNTGKRLKHRLTPDGRVMVTLPSSQARQPLALEIY